MEEAAASVAENALSRNDQRHCVDHLASPPSLSSRQQFGTFSLVSDAEPAVVEVAEAELPATAKATSAAA